MSLLQLVEQQSYGYTPLLAVRPVAVYRQTAERWVVRVTADQLSGLAAGPDAASELSARRRYLGRTDQNRAFAEMLRTRPADFGGTGDPITLGGGQIQYDGHRLTLLGVECVDGFQRLTELARAASEFPTPRLSTAVVALELVLGEERARARALSDRAHSLIHPLQAQDNLVRCGYLGAIKRDFEQGGGPAFDVRTGFDAGPHCAGYSITDVFRALAAAAPSMHMAHALSTTDGLNRLWSDIEGPTYRSLVNADVQACGLQRALEARQIVLQALGKVGKPVRGHAHIINHAPELFVWTVFRSLPLSWLHRSGRIAPRWSELFEDLPEATRRVAKEIVARYVRLCPTKERDFKGDIARIETWLELLPDLQPT